MSSPLVVFMDELCSSIANMDSNPQHDSDDCKSTTRTAIQITIIQDNAASKPVPEARRKLKVSSSGSLSCRWSAVQANSNNNNNKNNHSSASLATMMMMMAQAPRRPQQPRPVTTATELPAAAAAAAPRMPQRTSLSPVRQRNAPRMPQRSVEIYPTKPTDGFIDKESPCLVHIMYPPDHGPYSGSPATTTVRSSLVERWRRRAAGNVPELPDQLLATLDAAMQCNV